MEKKSANTTSGLTQKLDLSAVRVPASLKSVNPFSILIGAAIGGAVMYLLDPVQGPHRRATIMSKGAGLRSMTSDTFTRSFSGVRDLITSFLGMWSTRAADVADDAINSVSR